MFGLKVSATFRKDDLQSTVEKNVFRSIGHAAATVRKTAQRSIKRIKKASAPGRAPHTSTGALKRAITYETTDKKTAVIGPHRVSRFGSVWNLHEFGGVVTRPYSSKVVKRKKRTVIAIGGYGPVRKKKKNRRAVYVRIVSERQLRLAKRIQASIDKKEQKKPDYTWPKRYPARPFMKPALTAHMSRMPKFFTALT